MLYCFVKQSLSINMNSDLRIQAAYAKLLGCFCEVDSVSCLIYDDYGRITNIDKKLVFLRSDYEHLNIATKIILYHGGVLFEDELHRKIIKAWPSYFATKRKMFQVQGSDYLSRNYSQEFSDFLSKQNKLFIKTSDKGYSKVISLSDLSDYIRNIETISQRKYIISEEIELVQDQFGNKEARFFVMDSKVINFSRYLHSLNHFVEQQFIDKAHQLVFEIDLIEGFPKNYVMDLGLVKSESQNYIDIVEFNSITTSLCYINNSIFTQVHQRISNIKNTLSYGTEYCFDYLKNPTNYYLKNDQGANYTYIEK